MHVHARALTSQLMMMCRSMVHYALITMTYVTHTYLGLGSTSSATLGVRRQVGRRKRLKLYGAHAPEMHACLFAKLLCKTTHVPPNPAIVQQGERCDMPIARLQQAGRKALTQLALIDDRAYVKTHYGSTSSRSCHACMDQHTIRPLDLCSPTSSCCAPTTMCQVIRFVHWTSPECVANHGRQRAHAGRGGGEADGMVRIRACYGKLAAIMLIVMRTQGSNGLLIR